MIKGEFIINGIESKELKSHIEFRPQIATPRRKVERREVGGVSGAYLYDEEAYENTPIDLELILQAGHSDDIGEIKDLIAFTFQGGRYIDFTPYWDKNMVYRVEVVEPPMFRPIGTFDTICRYTVSLSAKPFREYTEKIISSNGTIENPTLYPAKPIITLTGTGDMKLIVNGEEYVFKNIDDNIIIDSQIESAYRMVGGKPNGRDNRMYTMDFPIFKSGKNVISTSGNATKFKVEVRWVKLVS